MPKQISQATISPRKQKMIRRYLKIGGQSTYLFAGQSEMSIVFW